MLSILVDNAAVNELWILHQIFYNKEIFVMSCNFMSCNFMSCNFMSCIFMSVIFMPCNLVRHFHVRLFQRPLPQTKKNNWVNWHILSTKGVILTGQTRLWFGSIWFSSVHFGRMRGQNHVRFTLVQYGACWYKKNENKYDYPDNYELQQHRRSSVAVEWWLYTF